MSKFCNMETKKKNIVKTVELRLVELLDSTAKIKSHM